MNKLFNLISLTECGFYGHLEEDGLFYLNMDVYCRSRRYSPLSFSKLSRLQNETDKKQGVVLFFCHEHVLETMSVELHGRSHPAHNAARTVHYPEHKPCGCQGMKSYRVPQGGMVSKGSVSKAVLILQVLGPQG